VREMIPRALKKVHEREATPWPQNGAAWEEARRELIRIALGQPLSVRRPLTSDHAAPATAHRQYLTAAIGVLGVAALAGIVTLLALRLRKKRA